MAYQHFYSCVPARISMYNRIDSFDTFAHSGLDRGFVLGELSALYGNKMRHHDMGRVRRGEIPTVYAQAMMRPGVTVQSALTYLPLDFTGERSGYFVHSLVLNEQERSMVFANPGALCFNPEMFRTDIRPFNITSQGAKPDPAYPECQYTPHPMNDPMVVISKYHPELINYFLFSVIDSICGSGREVVFRLPCEDKYASGEALELINAITAVLPYPVRELLSFVTFVGHYDQYPGFKLKCVSRDILRMPPERGVFIDFEKNSVSGFIENIEVHRPLVSFLYSLLGNKQIRDEFHLYLSRIMATYNDRPLTVAMLGETVFLFWCLCGFYTEESVLPGDESVLQAFSIYERYREAIIDDHRKQLYKSLDRYPRDHRAIPDGSFRLLKNLYPGETPAAKAVCLDVLLKLIHTDIMRGRLFTFIKENYDGELDEVKPTIVKNLCSVFYGGFLQQVILDFFDSIYDKEPEETGSFIIDKLLLSIRTPAVQAAVVGFIDKHYASITTAQKSKIYTTYLEMLPECDQLSAYLIVLINKHIAGEPEKLKDVIYRRTAAYLDAEYSRQGQRLLLPMLIEHKGFNEDLAVRFILTERFGSEMYYHYIGILASLAADERALRLIGVYKSLPKEFTPVIDRLVSDFGRVETQLGSSTMYDFMRLEYSLARISDSSAELIRRVIVYPHMINTLYHVFSLKYGKSGIDRLLKYAEGRDVIKSCAQYQTVLDYLKICELANEENVVGVFRIVQRLPRSEALRRDIAEHIRICSVKESELSDRAAFLFNLLINYLKSGNFHFDSLYFRYKELYAEDAEYNLGSRANPERVESRSASDAVELLLSFVIELCYVFGDYDVSVLAESTGIHKCIESFIESYGIGAGGFLKKYILNAPDELQEIVNELIKERNSRIGGVRDVVDLVNQSLRR